MFNLESKVLLGLAVHGNDGVAISVSRDLSRTGFLAGWRLGIGRVLGSGWGRRFALLHPQDTAGKPGGDQND